MSIDFFVEECREATNESEFGLCDDENGQKAYIDTTNSDNWIATVRNARKLDIVFTAIDNCIIKSNEFEGSRRCDGMLTTDNHLYLVELKNQKPPWRQGALKQLVSTVHLISESIDISIYKHKKVFACNKQRPRFQEIDNELNLKFYRKYNFRIDIQGTVVIV